MAVLKKHAIITGGSSGIGKALAVSLAQRGYHLTLIARDPEKLSQAVAHVLQQCCDKQQQILGLAADVRQEVALHEAIEHAVLVCGAPDLLITSAGMAHPDYFDNLSSDVFKQTMDINYFGTVYAIKAVFPHMQHRQSGHIVMISSGAGLVGLFGYSAYSPSKFAVRGLAESLRPEFRKLGIQVSIVYPPDTDTPQLLQENQTKPEETKRITQSIKLWPADKVADCILKGVSKNKFHITPGTSTFLLRFLHSTLFHPLNFYLDRLSQSNNASLAKKAKE